MHAGAILAERGWDVTYLSAPSKLSDLVLPKQAGIREYQTSPRKDFTVSAADYFQYCSAAIGLALKLRPDVIYVSDSLGTLPGLLARLICKSIIVYHEHDSPNRQSDLNPLIRWSRAQMLKLANVVVFPNMERALHAHAEVLFQLDKLKIVWNLPRREEVSTNSLSSDATRPFTLYYHGSITPDRIPFTLVEALKRFDGKVHLVIAGYESGSNVGYVGSMIKAVEGTPVEGCIRYLGQVQRKDLFSTSQSGDLGLALMPLESDDVNMAHMAGASNKAFDYMASGLLPLVSNLPEWIDMFVTPQFAVAADPRSVDNLCETISTVMVNIETYRAGNQLRRAKILSDWNYDQVFCEAVLPLLYRQS
jgi:glycosyltransferase involved in cell wall biosynthesis